jgi:hypothetical protein
MFVIGPPTQQTRDCEQQSGRCWRKHQDYGRDGLNGAGVQMDYAGDQISAGIGGRDRRRGDHWRSIRFGELGQGRPFVGFAIPTTRAALDT